MIFSVKMICSRFTAEWLENKMVLPVDPNFEKDQTNDAYLNNSWYATLFLFYKNHFYKNVEICPKI